MCFNNIRQRYIYIYTQISNNIPNKKMSAGLNTSREFDLLLPPLPNSSHYPCYRTLPITPVTELFPLPLLPNSSHYPCYRTLPITPVTELFPLPLLPNSSHYPCYRTLRITRQYVKCILNLIFTFCRFREA